MDCFFNAATTTTAQSFTGQLNSSSKTGTTATIVATTVDTSKNSVRPHQILSRETSFISKPTTTEEKDETNTVVVPIVTTPQVSVAPQITVPIISTAATVASTVTITSMF